MASIYDLKPKFQALLLPVCRQIAQAGVTANQVTVFALILSAGWGLGFLINGQAVWLLFLPIVLFVRMALNAIDGMLAREFNQKSNLGAILNELGDVFSDLFLYLPFAFIPGVPGTLVVGVVALGIVSEMTGVLAVMIGASRRYEGPFGKSDRAFFFGLGAVIIGLGMSPGPWAKWVLLIGIMLSVVTIFNRARAGLKEVGDHSDG